MRDYAELIAGLRDCAKHTCCSAPAVTGVAADAIEELLAENKEILYRVEIAENMIAFYQEGKPLPNVPRWISLEERLPEKHIEVLVCTEDYGKTELGFANVAVWDGSEWIETWDRKESIHYVTHWMPLPKAPEEVE